MVTGALIVGGVFTAGSLYYQNKAAKEQKKANELRRRQAELSANRKRREQIRQARMASAAAKVSAEAQGASTSSGAQGGLSSIISQMGANLGFLDQSQEISDQASEAIGRAIGYGNKAQIASGIGSLAFSYGSYRAGQGETPKKVTPKSALTNTGSSLHNSEFSNTIFG